MNRLLQKVHQPKMRIRTTVLYDIIVFKLEERIEYVHQRNREKQQLC